MATSPSIGAEDDDESDELLRLIQAPDPPSSDHRDVAIKQVLRSLKRGRCPTTSSSETSEPSHPATTEAAEVAEQEALMHKLLEQRNTELARVSKIFTITKDYFLSEMLCCSSQALLEQFVVQCGSLLHVFNIVILSISVGYMYPA